MLQIELLRGYLHSIGKQDSRLCLLSAYSECERYTASPTKTALEHVVLILEQGLALKVLLQVLLCRHLTLKRMHS